MLAAIFKKFVRRSNIRSVLRCVVFLLGILKMFVVHASPVADLLCMPYIFFLLFSLPCPQSFLFSLFFFPFLFSFLFVSFPFEPVSTYRWHDMYLIRNMRVFEV